MDECHAVTLVVDGVGVAYCNGSIMSGQDVHSVVAIGTLRLLEHLRVPSRTVADRH